MSLHIHKLNALSNSSKHAFLYSNRNFSIAGQPDILYAHYGNLARKAELCVTYNPPGETVPGIYNFASDLFSK